MPQQHMTNFPVNSPVGENGIGFVTPDKYSALIATFDLMGIFEPQTTSAVSKEAPQILCNIQSGFDHFQPYLRFFRRSEQFAGNFFAIQKSVRPAEHNRRASD